jgi:hypothetical protein
MTPPLDLDALEAVAKAAEGDKPGDRGTRERGMLNGIRFEAFVPSGKNPKMEYVETSHFTLAYDTMARRERDADELRRTALALIAELRAAREREQRVRGALGALDGREHAAGAMATVGMDFACGRILRALEGT